MSTGHNIVTTPNTKLDHLCERANAIGGTLVNHAAVARAIGATPSRISQLFGYGQETEGTTLPAGMEGRLVHAFNSDGVPLELGWLFLPLPTFKSRLAAPAASRPTRIEIPWRATESNPVPALVEFRLHEPTVSNRALALPATLLLGRVEYEDEGFALALRDAVATLDSPAYKPAPAEPAPNLARIAGGTRIAGPRDGDALHGDPLGDSPLMHVEPHDDCPEAPDELTILIHAGRRGFIATALDPSPADTTDPETKDALINLILERASPLGTTQDTARPILARATLRRCPPL